MGQKQSQRLNLDAFVTPNPLVKKANVNKVNNLWKLLRQLTDEVVSLQDQSNSPITRFDGTSSSSSSSSNSSNNNKNNSSINNNNTRYIPDSSTPKVKKEKLDAVDEDVVDDDDENLLQEYVPKLLLQEKDEVIATLQFQLKELRDEIIGLHRKHEMDLDVIESNKRRMEIQLLKEQLKETQEETSNLRNELKLKNYKLDDLQRLIELHMIEDGNGSKILGNNNTQRKLNGNSHGNGRGNGCNNEGRGRGGGHGHGHVGIDPKVHDDEEVGDDSHVTDEGDVLEDDESLYTEATLPETQFWTQKQKQKHRKKLLNYEKPVLSRVDTLSSISRRSGSSDGGLGGFGHLNLIRQGAKKMTRQKSVELTFDDSSDSNHSHSHSHGHSHGHNQNFPVDENDKAIHVVEDHDHDHDDGIVRVSYRGNQSTSQEYSPFTTHHQEQAEREETPQTQVESPSQSQSQSQKSEQLASEPNFENQCDERIIEIQTSDAEDEFMNYENGTVNRYTQHSHSHSHSIPSSPTPQFRTQGKFNFKSPSKSTLFPTGLATITTLDRQQLSNHNDNLNNNNNNNSKIPRSINMKVTQTKIINLTQNPFRKGPWWPEDFKINPLTNFGQDQELQIRKLDSSNFVMLLN
ncbi:unnamed protein product [Ambrosiozyma monospora]|uniref:Unnamed protein product n=1 Tax=Ambrosiozyma monospora TaxID=43982 RepID=A0A9W7DHV7_AMBMO|nr:unnamed protein product [Ambrosiozyma monospora]